MKPLLLYGLGLLCLGATILPFSKAGTWWVRACDFPRIQIAVMTAATLAGIVAFIEISVLSAMLVFALLACLVVQLAVILPYTRLWPIEARGTRDAAGPRTLSLLIVNVLMENRAADRLAELVAAHDPDLILAVETDAWWCQHLEGALPHHSARIAHPLSNTYGMMLLSRLELVDPEVRFLLKADIPSIRTGVRLRSGDVITLYGLHPEPPSPTEADTSLPRDAELVLAGREIARSDRPAIIAGDLNDVAWSHVTRLFRRLSDMLDPRIGRGLYATFNARRPLLRWPLDHIFFTEDFRLVRLERMGFIGSDHFPILVELSYEPERADAQEARVVVPGDRAMVRRKIRRARGSP